MTRRLPLIPTAIVAAAVIAMIALGVWQFGRSAEKGALIASYRAAAGRPPVAFPTFPDQLKTAMFRRSQTACVAVAGWRIEIGRAADGQSGYRHIAQCRTGAEGPGVLIDMGISADPSAATAWNGGVVDGLIASEPDHNSLIARVLGRAKPLRPMLIADNPAPGLKPSAKPSPEDIPNNHFSYGVQWLLFAAVAAVIYGLALRKRWSEAP